METLKASCIYCGKEVFSLYKKQLEHNIDEHERSCPIGQKEKLKGESNFVKHQGKASS